MEIFTLPKNSSIRRWISFISKYRCSPTQSLCSNVMLYDRTQNWLRNLTDFGEAITELEWSPTDKIEIPWEVREGKAIAISPDGNFIALGGVDSKVRVWKISDRNGSFDNNEPEQILDTEKGDVFNNLTYSPDGNWLAAGTSKGIVYIWSLPGWELTYYQRSTGFIKKLVFTHDNTNCDINIQ
jgi:WD40 repeat protein